MVTFISVYGMLCRFSPGRRPSVADFEIRVDLSWCCVCRTLIYSLRWTSDSNPYSCFEEEIRTTGGEAPSKMMLRKSIKKAQLRAGAAFIFLVHQDGPSLFRKLIVVFAQYSAACCKWRLYLFRHHREDKLVSACRKESMVLITARRIYSHFLSAAPLPWPLPYRSQTRLRAAGMINLPYRFPITAISLLGASTKFADVGSRHRRCLLRSPR